MATQALTMVNFESTIQDNEVLLIDFWADWCGPCKMFGPVFEKVSEKHPDAVFAKVNTEEEQELAGVFGVRSIPTVAIFRDQVLVYKQAGALAEGALEDLLEKVKALDMDEIRAQIASEEAQAGAEAQATA
ncbi:MAG: thioredoxin [Proteobacteria bacterium]|nr:thioredoxin [Pseudomonadota bacterium]